MKRSVLVILVFTMVLVIWGTCFYLTKSAWDDGADTLGMFGVFGSSFGTVAALFSGLAFTGVVIALILQAQDTKRQRSEFLVQAKITACAAIIEAEKTLSDYYEQAAHNNAPPPIPNNLEVTWADMIQESRYRILNMSAELEKSREALMQEKD